MSHEGNEWIAEKEHEEKEPVYKSHVRYFDTHDETVEKWACPQCEKHEVSGVVVYARDGEMLKIRWLECDWCGWDQMS